MVRDLNKLMKGAASGAALQETAESESTSSKAVGYRQKKLNRVPLTYFDAHKKLKESGRTFLNFEAYIMDAVKKKLEDDGVI